MGTRIMSRGRVGLTAALAFAALVGLGGCKGKEPRKGGSAAEGSPPAAAPADAQAAAAAADGAGTAQPTGATAADGAPSGAQAPADAGSAAAVPGDREAWFQAPPDLTNPPADAERAKSGLITRVLTPGSGSVRPRGDDWVLVHYSVWNERGKLIDSSVKRDKPRVLRPEKQIAGWDEALRLMVVGEKRRIWMPEKLAYKGRAEKPRGTLVWDAQLLEIRPAPPAPADLKKPPADAQRTASGLVWKTLQPGKGGDHPKASSMVSVHYTGWTLDGKCFDSSLAQGEPAQFLLEEVIKGWTEGVQLLTAGEKARFWVPKELAYKGQDGKPQGLLVFDVELLEFSP